VIDLLTENLNEEMAAAAKITEAAKPILLESSEEPEQRKKPKSAKERYSAQKSREDERLAAGSVRKRAS
jgi:hypothetical protein